MANSCYVTLALSSTIIEQNRDLEKDKTIVLRKSESITRDKLVTNFLIKILKSITYIRGAIYWEP